ncbi:MAG TPA: fibronectin type III domain-containing protein [Pyrinomonadaceae bacterium]|nr:fibronectin type III domain-containing protein [Pyrinomonadaceae bacterium]
MTTQTLARLIVATAALVLLTALLFNGRTAFAAKADKLAPTTPTNLVVTAITQNTVSLRWNASTDNSGKFSYRVKVNSLNNATSTLEFVSQTQTIYTVQYMVPFYSYSFAVYAVDGSGNRSSDSNLVTADIPGDTVPPSAPVLQATTLGPSQVQLTWTNAVDNLPNNCCSYAFSRNGSPLTQNINAAAAPSGYQSVIIRHLPPGSNNTFAVTAIDYTGRNSSTSNTANAQTWPSVDTTPPSAPTNLHIVSLDTGGGEAWLGWTQSTDETDAQNNIEYEIYVNGILSPLPVSAGVDLDFAYTLMGVCENTFTVKAVDKTGNTSAASAPVKVKLWVC